MRHAFLGFCIIAGAVAPVLAHAEKPSPVFETWGAGDSSCGTWLQARTGITSHLYEQWVEGFISGNIEQYSFAKNENVGFSTDANGIFYWIDNYCRSNPTDNLAQASQSFIVNSKTMVFSPVGTPPP
jgi:hypothetical protein